MGSEKRSFIPLRARRVSLDYLDQQVFSPEGSKLLGKGFAGVIPYGSDVDPIIYEFDRLAVFDREKRKVELLGKASAHLDKDSLTIEIKDQDFDQLIQRASQVGPGRTAHFSVKSAKTNCSEEEYKKNVEQIIEQIRSGRMYQLNYLRYFGLDQELDGLALIEQSQTRMSMYSKVGNHELISCSPERFVQIVPGEEGLTIRSYPIKGTVVLGEDLDQRETQVQRLINSKKDQAELAMIVDLMRNDMYPLSIASSLRVIDASRVIRLKNVAHLQTTVEATMRENLTFADFRKALLPAGSITGAPKKEVMTAIAEFEKQDRGYFMGTGFIWDQSGYFDSSVLIRTLVSTDSSASKKQHYEFAVGSGIVVHSQPEDECKEVYGKADILGIHT